MPGAVTKTDKSIGDLVSVKLSPLEQPKLAPSIKEARQFSLEMDHFSDCILEDKLPFTPGEEGLQDQKIMEAIYESARTGKAVKLEMISKTDAFRGTPPKKIG